MPDPRRTETSAERAECEEIEKSLKTSSYLTDDFWENIHSGIKPQKSYVPNYKQPTKGEMLSGTSQSRVAESDGLHMDLEGFYKTASDGMSPDQLHNAMQDAYPTKEGEQSTFVAGSPLPNIPPPSQINTNRVGLSKNQAMAIKKYPVLVEFLGRDGGEKIAKKISGEMNLVMAEIVHENSKEANENAIMCKADKQNLREYFVGDGWACRVTASGPFRGDEVIYYHRAKDLACVLRKSETDEGVKYSDVSDQFNVIYEAEEGDISPANIVEEPVEEPVEGEENDN